MRDKNEYETTEIIICDHKFNLYKKENKNIEISKKKIQFFNKSVCIK